MEILFSKVSPEGKKASMSHLNNCFWFSFFFYLNQFTLFFKFALPFLALRSTKKYEKFAPELS